MLQLPTSFQDALHLHCESAVLDAEGRRTGSALRSIAHELARVLCDDDGLELAQEMLGLIQQQTKSRGWDQIGASFDHGVDHRWRTRVIAVFDPDFNDEAHVELPRFAWAFIVSPRRGGVRP